MVMKRRRLPTSPADPASAGSIALADLPPAAAADSPVAVRLAVWGLVALVSLVHGRICSQGFVNWDDRGTLYDNPSFNPPTLGNILWYWTHAHLHMYIPTTYTVWGLIALIAYNPSLDANGLHLNPLIYHFVSLAAHAITTLIVFAILRRLCGRIWPAAAGAALFAVHPVQVETVAWATSLKEGLCGLLGLLGLLVYLVAAQAERAVPPRRAWLRYALAEGLIILGQLANPMAVVIPLMGATLDLLVLRRPVRRVLASAGPLMVCSLAVALIARFVQPGYVAPPTPLWARPLIVGDTLCFYLGKLFLPLTLCTDYGRRPDLVIARGWVYWTWIAPALLAILIALRSRNRLWLAAGALLLPLGAAPVLGLIPFDLQQFSTPADRYLYLSLLGPSLIAAMYFATASRPRGVKIAFAVVLLLLSVKTVVQTGVWRDSHTLWRHTADVSPGSALAHNNLGAEDDAMVPPRFAEGLHEYQLAVRASPDWLPALNNLILGYVREGRIDDAIPVMRRLVWVMDHRKWGPDESPPPDAYVALATVLLQRGEKAEAMGYLKRAIELKPDYAAAKSALAEAERSNPQKRSLPATVH